MKILRKSIGWWVSIQHIIVHGLYFRSEIIEGQCWNFDIYNVFFQLLINLKYMNRNWLVIYPSKLIVLEFDVQIVTLLKGYGWRISPSKTLTSADKLCQVRARFKRQYFIPSTQIEKDFLDNFTKSIVLVLFILIHVW